MKMGEVQASHMTMFTVIAEVVSSAFSGKGGSTHATDADIEDLTKLDTASYVSRVNQLFSGSF